MKGTIGPRLRELLKDPKKYREWVENYFDIKFINKPKNDKKG